MISLDLAACGWWNLWQRRRRGGARHPDLSDSAAASFFFTAEAAESGRPDSLVEGWDIVEHPTFPPPPSQSEDIEHWTRAMIIDATTTK